MIKKCIGHLHVIDGMGTKYMNYGFSLGISGDMRLSDAGVCLCVSVCDWDLKRINDISDPTAAAPYFHTNEFSVL